MTLKATTFNVTWKAKTGDFAQVRHFKTLEEARQYIFEIEHKANSVTLTRIDTTHTRINHIWKQEQLPTQ